MRDPYDLVVKGAIGSVLLIAVVVLPSCPWVYSAHIEIDRNSGDMLHYTCILGHRVGEHIQTSSLSDELRRLAISLPESRRWTPFITRPVVGSNLTYRYTGLLCDCMWLIESFDRVKMPDQERAEILERALVSFQEADRIGIERLRKEVGPRLIPPELRNIPGSPFSRREEETLADRTSEVGREGTAEEGMVNLWRATEADDHE